MRHIKSFNEIVGGYRGDYFSLPNIEDLKDIYKGLSISRILQWTPPEKRIALSRTEIDLRDKKREILNKYGCPSDWIKRKLTKEDVINVIDKI